MVDPLSGDPHKTPTGGEKRHPVPGCPGHLAVDQHVLQLANARGTQGAVAVAGPAGPHGEGDGGGPRATALLLAATPQGLTRVAFEGHADFDALRARATRASTQTGAR